MQSYFIPGQSEEFAALEQTLKEAISHLERVLNGCRTHAEQQAADSAAREFLSGLI